MSGELSELIRRVKRIPGLAVRAAPAVAEAVDASVRADLAAGRSPEGEAWAPRKQDGGRRLPNAAANAIVTRAIGTTIVQKTAGHYWAHNRGTSHVPRSGIIPQRITPKLADAIRGPVVEAFNRDVRRG